MGEFLHKYNTDNVHSRAVIIGLINLLNTKITYDNVLGDNNVDEVEVPFFYSMTGDERFLQDYFLDWNECISPRVADGNYDVIPRGIAKLTGNTINTSAMTHRFVRGNYVQEVNGQLQTYNAFLNSIPLTMDFEIEIETDTNLDAFKIQQSIIETFYKTQVFSVSYKGFRVPCQVGFPEDYGLDKTFEFTYESNEVVKLKFTLAVETYQPVIDSSTRRSNANRITTVGGAGIGIETINDTMITGFEFTGPSSNQTYFSGNSLNISWSYKGEILRVNLYYRFAGTTDDWTMITRSVENIGEYDWTLPFFRLNGDLIANDPIRAYAVSSTGKGAKLRAIANANGEIDNIIIVDGGYGYNNNDTIEVSPLIPPTSGFTPPQISANVANGQIIGFDIIDAGADFVPTAVNYIELKIENAVKPEIYNVWSSSQKFTGNTDPMLSLPGLRQITNINPSVAEMQSLGINLSNIGLSGQGVQTGTNIISADVINNLITIDLDVTLFGIEGEYIIDPQTAIFEVQ